MTAIETTERRLFIGGEWVDSGGGGTFDVCDPFTGDAVATVAAGTRDDAKRAVAAAAEAFPAWAAAPPAAIVPWRLANSLRCLSAGGEGPLCGDLPVPGSHATGGPHLFCPGLGRGLL